MESKSRADIGVSGYDYHNGPRSDRGKRNTRIRQRRLLSDGNGCFELCTGGNHRSGQCFRYRFQRRFAGSQIDDESGLYGRDTRWSPIVVVRRRDPCRAAGDDCFQCGGKRRSWTFRDGFAERRERQCFAGDYFSPVKYMYESSGWNGRGIGSSACRLRLCQYRIAEDCRSFERRGFSVYLPYDAETERARYFGSEYYGVTRAGILQFKKCRESDSSQYSNYDWRRNVLSKSVENSRDTRQCRDNRIICL